MAETQELSVQQISKHERQIKLTDVFGKASSALGLAGLGYVLFELGRIAVFATDTATQQVFNPADHVAPGLIAFAVSMTAGLTGMYLGRHKQKLASEFNQQVRKEFENMGFALVEDKEAAPSSGGSSLPSRGTKWVRRREAYDYGYTPVVYRPYNDRFFEGFWLASIMNSGGGSSRSSGGSYRSSSSSSSKNSGQGAAIALAAVILIAAAAAAGFVNWKSFKRNFLEKPENLLTGPEPDVFGGMDDLDDLEPISMDSDAPGLRETDGPKPGY